MMIPIDMIRSIVCAYSRRFRIPLFLCVFALVAIIRTDLLGRAGGAGDFDSGGGGGGDDGIGILIYLILRIIMQLPFPWNLIVSALVVIGFIIFSRMAKNKVKARTVLNRLPTGDTVKKAEGYGAFMKNNPDFDEEAFKNIVKEAFMKIQKAWEAQNLSDVRRFISDGVYQRFNTQFKMMELLKQKNVISDISIKNVYVDRVESDGLYDIIHVAVHASLQDQFVSELDPSLNTGGHEEFVEYWSFLKKRGKPRTDIYWTDNCPNCGAPLPEDMGEVSKCASCGTLTNSGEYDWVLSEITQADDYVATPQGLGKSPDLTEKVRRLIDENDDFAVQLIEDKASNGYLQIMTARALGDPAIMRRFVSDVAFNKIGMPDPGSRVAYNRIYLNRVHLVGVAENDGKNVLAIAVKSSYQRVRVEGGRAVKLDQSVVSQTDVIFMSRDKNAAESKGSLYAHSCPSCGAPVENSLAVECRYCGSVMNSTGAEWIITDIMSMDEYRNYLSEHGSEFAYRVKPESIDRLYDVRDYAFNNVMVLIAADGEYREEERRFAGELAGKWGYDVSKLEPFFQMARAGRLVIRMPEDRKKQRKIFELMKKAAEADQNVSPEEERLLDEIRQRYEIDGAA